MIIEVSKGKPLDRYGLRVRPNKEIPNGVAWLFQAFLISMAKLVELRKRFRYLYVTKTPPNLFEGAKTK